MINGKMVCESKEVIVKYKTIRITGTSMSIHPSRLLICRPQPDLT